MDRLDTLDWISMILVIIGGINWGLIGFFDFNLVEAIFGLTVSRIIYGLVGIGAIYLIYTTSKISAKQKG